MKAWYTHYGILVCTGLTLTGCSGAVAQSRVREQAAFDHDCSEEEVSILEENRKIWAYKLDVCGEVRKYRDFGNEEEFQFVDVTDGNPPGPTPD
jgi:hypothetical protein